MARGCRTEMHVSRWVKAFGLFDGRSSKLPEGGPLHYAAQGSLPSCIVSTPRSPGSAFAHEAVPLTPSAHLSQVSEDSAIPTVMKQILQALKVLQAPAPKVSASCLVVLQHASPKAITARPQRPAPPPRAFVPLNQACQSWKMNLATLLAPLSPHSSIIYPSMHLREAAAAYDSL